ncbi:MAG: hypothetical protein U9N44_00080 [Chloroflexota bacterium]|nr:hypothetical protein [Chloroflexota bacterium]
MANRVAITGIGLTHQAARRPDVNDAEMINEAVRMALADAQLEIKDIDAVLTNNMDGFDGTHLSDSILVDGSGAYMKSGMKFNTGGTVGSTGAISAFNMVASGIFDVVLTIGHQKQERGNTMGTLCGAAPGELRELVQGAIGAFAQAAVQYMKNTGAKLEHAGMVRLKSDRNACRNPYAHLRLGLKSIEDVDQSPMLIWPLRLLDFCPQSCGACAMIVASEKAAKRITKKPVWVADHETVHEMQSEVVFGGDEEKSQQIAAKRLYKRNGITDPAKDIDCFELYEPSSWEEMYLYEHFFLAEHNKGWKMIEKGVTELEGDIPVNPSGGVLATNAIGATAMVRIAEAALQIRGDAGEHQATKDVKTALASGLGGTNWTTLVLLKRSL